jgi:hypothetical protein
MKSVQRPRLIKAIMDKPLTAMEVSKVIHCHVRHARAILRELYLNGNAFIQEWHPAEYQGIPTAAYRFGIGVDAKKPRPMTNTERVRKMREKEDVEKKAFRLARERQLKRKIKRDPLTAAFFGSAS